MKYSQWTGWRKEEVSACKQYMKSLKSHTEKMSQRQLSNYLGKSYLLRDLTVAYLDTAKGPETKENGINKISNFLTSVFGKEVELKKVVQKSFDLWSQGGHSSVQCYLTPKAILYTARGDYEG